MAVEQIGFKDNHGFTKPFIPRHNF